MSAKILIVEDEQVVSMEIESYLKKMGYTIVAICSNADDAYYQAMHSDIDLILMDISLVDSSGIEAGKRIKAKRDIPIIFLTAYMDEDTIEKAIAVDPIAYLAKPFNRRELFVAIKIGLKKYHTSDNNERVGDIVLDNEFSFDTQSSELICCGEIVSLTKKERMLLKLFLDNPNRLISNITMEYEIWGDEPVNNNRRRTLVSRLRAKLKHKFIETRSLEGYIFRKK